MTKPAAILISDIHYNLKNLELSDAATRMALDRGRVLKIPVIIAGDLHDTKAMMRGEVVSRMIKTFSEYMFEDIYIIVGNHCRINEKAPAHSLEFLKPYAHIVDRKSYLNGWTLIPYHHDTEEFKQDLKDIEKGSTIITHQGVMEGDKGDYVHDKSAVPAEWLREYKVFSGHYHRHHRVGTCTYLGSPFTHTFGEANDGPKGYLVLNEDGTFYHNPLNFRKHVIKEIDLGAEPYGVTDFHDVHPTDLMWLKLKGTKSQLDSIKKQDLLKLIPVKDFKLDKIYEKEEKTAKDQKINLTSDAVLDSLIESLNETKPRKAKLKQLWRSIINEN